MTQLCRAATSCAQKSALRVIVIALTRAGYRAKPLARNSGFRMLREKMAHRHLHFFSDITLTVISYCRQPSWQIIILGRN